jgi:hypothetical protein
VETAEVGVRFRKAGLLKRQSALVAAAILLGLGSRPAAAEDPLASLVSQTETGAPSIIFYYPLCDVEAAGDCAVVEFICGDYAQLTMWLNDFDDSTLGNWLISSKARSIATAASGSINFHPYEIDFSELNASWNLKFYAIQDPKPWLQKLKDDPRVTISTGKGEIVVPQSPEGVINLQTFVASCGTYGQ